MNYSTIDPTINRWVNHHQLHLYTACKDEETRVVRITDEKGRTYGIGIDAPDARGIITIRAHAWDFKKRNKQYVVTESELEQGLEDALADLRTWISG